MSLADGDLELLEEENLLPYDGELGYYLSKLFNAPRFARRPTLGPNVA